MNKKMRYYLSLLALGIGGSSIWLLMYVRYVFYDQMIATLGVSNAQLGFLNTITSVLGLVMTLPNGIMADRFDSKRLIIFALFAMSACGFLFAFVTTYTMAIVVWALMGIFVGLGYWPSLIKFINSLAGPEDSGKSFSIYYGIYGVFAALVNVVEVWAGGKFGFHGALFVIAGINALAAVLDIFVLDGDKDKEKRGEVVAQEEGGNDKIRLHDLKLMAKWPGTYILMLAYFFNYMLYSNVSYFNPYLVNVMEIPAEVSSMLSIIRTYFLMLVCPIGGIIADKVFKSTAKTYIAAHAIIAVMFAIVFFFKPGMNVTFVAIYSLLPSLIVMPLYSITYSIMRELHIPPAISGTTVAVSGLLGSFVDGGAPVLLGRWLDVYGNSGYNYIFGALIVCCIGGSLTALWGIIHDKKCKSGKRVMVIKNEA